MGRNGGVEVVVKRIRIGRAGLGGGGANCTIQVGAALVVIVWCSILVSLNPNRVVQYG